VDSKRPRAANCTDPALFSAENPVRLVYILPIIVNVRNSLQFNTSEKEKATNSTALSILSFHLKQQQQHQQQQKKNLPTV
jgi:hypothetical protein